MPSLQFKGKTFVDNHHLSVPFHELRPVASKGTGKTASLRDNLIIHGDNLAALKALLPTYHNKVKCIYIDPPYNTGNEGWAYNDNVNSPMMRDWLGKTVDRDDLTRHDKWCCMMLPRLKLLRDLLRQDGAIFISIDDNEVHHLRCLLDEVFGEENFLATAIWQKNFSPRNTARQFSEDHDFVVIYAQDAQQWGPNLLERSEQATSRYKNLDDDPRGDWSSSDLTARNYYSLGTYEVTSPSGKTFRPSVGNYFRVSPGRFAELDQDNRIWWGPNGNSMPRLKRYLSEVKKGVVPQTLWPHAEVGHTQDAKKELVSVLDFERSEDVFNTVKPTGLIRRILEIATDRDSIVLDSFAGSGTTAHAVLALNKKDGGNRRFVLIECEDYADSITAERVRRVIKGVPSAKDATLKAGLGGSFSYFELGSPMQQESLLAGRDLPDYEALAGYVFFTATGEQFDPRKIDRETDHQQRQYQAGDVFPLQRVVQAGNQVCGLQYQRNGPGPPLAFQHSLGEQHHENAEQHPEQARHVFARDFHAHHLRKTQEQQQQAVEPDHEREPGGGSWQSAPARVPLTFGASLGRGQLRHPFDGADHYAAHEVLLDERVHHQNRRWQ